MVQCGLVFERAAGDPERVVGVENRRHRLRIDPAQARREVAENPLLHQVATERDIVEIGDPEPVRAALQIAEGKHAAPVREQRRDFSLVHFELICQKVDEMTRIQGDFLPLGLKVSGRAGRRLRRQIERQLAAVPTHRIIPHPEHPPAGRNTVRRADHIVKQHC
ncbi:hypothetical protein SDC9_185585 [bioreactor metagenome]|uniref:Uncharacterized protein n=1 Tax=bioreactor metagenome TaxID=1076179 RepID=A0A645HI44_9ZZZZ